MQWVALLLVIACHRDAAAPCPPASLDADGDGFGDPNAATDACAPDAVQNEDDCDDLSAQVHPDAIETCNERDDDCDGVVDDGFDEDEDGQLSTACEGGADCDDSDADVYEGADEVCGDGRDNDCRDGDLECSTMADARAKIVSTDLGADMAREIRVGDFDGDGTLDTLVAAEFSHDYRGGAHVFFGPLSGTHEAQSAGVFARATNTSAAGRSIGAGDLDDDGFLDIALGAPYSDEAFVLFGPVTTDFDLEQSSVHVSGPTGTLFGHGSAVGDLDDDGVDDLIVGAYDYTSGAPHSGSMFVHYGPLSESELVSVDDCDAELIGAQPDLEVGRVVEAGADMNGDGIGDVIAEAFGYPAKTYAGGVIVAHGPFGPTFDLDGADALLVGENAYDFAGSGLAQGDLDGDGLADALIGAPWARQHADGPPDGAAYVVSGHTTGMLGLGDADVVIHGTRGSSVGMALTVGDVDANGEADLVVGAPSDNKVTGAALVFYAAMPGSWDDTDAVATFLGESSYDGAGSEVVVADLDANGSAELLLGAPLESSGAEAAGAMYVLELF
jgi:hypothetical protein